MSVLDDVEKELRRIVDRLNSAPLSKVEPLSGQCHDVACYLVDQTRVLGADIPADASLPVVGPSAVGAQLAVVGRDYLDAARRASAADASAVLEQLTELRRALP